MIQRKYLRLFYQLAVIAGLVLGLSLQVLDAQAQATNTISLSVVDIETGLPIEEFKYLFNVDNTGDPFNHTGCDPTDPTYPDNCDLPSIRTVPGWSPIYTQGDQDSGPITFDAQYAVDA